MNWDKFSQFFHPSWHSKIKKFIESQECDEIYRFLKSESKSSKIIAPESKNVFRAFKETSLDNLKVVIVGLSPYHTLKNNSVIIADGLLMGCSITNLGQPSLNQFYEALSNEFYPTRDVNILQDADVSYLAHQGVLMLNAALTAEIGKAATHLDLWEPFIKFLFEEIINDLGVPVVFLGKQAAKLNKYTHIFDDTFLLSHPASASYNKAIWDTGTTFRDVSKRLKQNNNQEIKWLQIIK